MTCVYHAADADKARKILVSGFSLGVSSSRSRGDGQFGYSILGLVSGVYACETAAEVRKYGPVVLKLRLKPGARFLNMTRPEPADAHSAEQIARWGEFVNKLGLFVGKTVCGLGYRKGIVFNESLRRLIRVAGLDGLMGADLAGGGSRTLVISHPEVIESVEIQEEK